MSATTTPATSRPAEFAGSGGGGGRRRWVTVTVVGVVVLAAGAAAAGLASGFGTRGPAG